MDNAVEVQIHLQSPMMPTTVERTQHSTSAATHKPTEHDKPIGNVTIKQEVRPPQAESELSDSIPVPVKTTPPDEDDVERSESLISSRHSSVSPAIDIKRRTSSFDGITKLEVDDVLPPMASSSFLARQVAEIEASTRGSDVIDDTGNGTDGNIPQVDAEAGSSSGIKFEDENQLTVIPAKKQTPPGPSRLEDLFKQKMSDAAAETSFSYEIVDARSGHQIQPTSSNGSEIDVFKHLFDDDEGK